MSIYTTTALMALVQTAKHPSTALLDRFFPRVQENTDGREDIAFDVIDRRRRIAPMVHPTSQGQIVEGAGFTTKTFRPAYVKDKRPLDVRRPMKRAPGEEIGGSMTPVQREQWYLAGEIEDQLEMLTRREELMAMEALTTGKVTVKGENYPEVVVDFGRDNALTPSALTSTLRWGESAADPLVNLMTWSGLVQQKSGVFPRDLIMGPVTLSKFIKAADVKDRLDQRQMTNVAMAIDSSDDEGLQYIGTIDGYRIWTYVGWYVDPDDNTEKAMLPAGRIILASPGIQGVRAYGSIEDPEAGYTATRYHIKSWTDPDPGRRILMLTSAPLVVPTIPNASLSLKVHD